MKNKTYQWAVFLYLGIFFLILSIYHFTLGQAYLMFIKPGPYYEDKLQLAILCLHLAAVVFCFELSYLFYKNKLEFKALGLFCAVLLSCWVCAESFLIIKNDYEDFQHSLKFEQEFYPAADKRYTIQEITLQQLELIYKNEANALVFITENNNEDCEKAGKAVEKVAGSFPVQIVVYNKSKCKEKDLGKQKEIFSKLEIKAAPTVFVFRGNYSDESKFDIKLEDSESIHTGLTHYVQECKNMDWYFTDEDIDFYFPDLSKRYKIKEITIEHLTAIRDKEVNALIFFTDNSAESKRVFAYLEKLAKTRCVQIVYYNTSNCEKENLQLQNELLKYFNVEDTPAIISQYNMNLHNNFFGEQSIKKGLNHYLDENPHYYLEKQLEEFLD